MSYSSLVRRLRARVLGHSLCSCFGCPHTPNALAQCCNAKWHEHRPWMNDYRIHKHWRLLAGSWPHVDFLNELFASFPALQSEINNPLWGVLSRLWDERRDTNQLAQTLHLENGHYLPEQGAFVMRRLCGCPDWRNLGYVLVLLGSTSRQFTTHRSWLRAHFLTYLLLVCMTEPFCFVRQPLYELLNELYERQFFERIDDWPSDFTAFEQTYQVINRYGDWLRYRGRLSGWDLYACTLVQHCWPDEAWLRKNALALVGPPAPFERSPRQAKWVETALKDHHRDRFAMGEWPEVADSLPVEPVPVAAGFS